VSNKNNIPYNGAISGNPTNISWLIQSKERQRIRNRIAKDIEEYLARGGKITVLPPCSFSMIKKAYGRDNSI
jgi:hypothetical protein